MKRKKGALIVLSGPSGSGKGTVVKRLLEIYKKAGEDLKLSISATTRLPREGDVDGVNYYFLSKGQFVDLISKNQILEYAEYCDNYYGTPRGPVEKWISQGHDVMLEIEVQGARQVMQNCPEVISVFMFPPSIKELEGRLRGRNTESEEVICERLAASRKEIGAAGDYQYFVINDTVDNAANAIYKIIRENSEKIQ